MNELNLTAIQKKLSTAGTLQPVIKSPINETASMENYHALAQNNLVMSPTRSAMQRRPAFLGAGGQVGSALD